MKIKKTISTVFISAVIVLLVTTGCKKYTCYCETLITPDPSVPASQQSGGASSFSVKGPKSKAQKKCNNFSTEIDANGDQTICRIK